MQKWHTMDPFYHFRKWPNKFSFYVRFISKSTLVWVIRVYSETSLGDCSRDSTERWSLYRGGLRILVQLTGDNFHWSQVHWSWGTSGCLGQLYCIWSGSSEILDVKCCLYVPKNFLGNLVQLLHSLLICCCEPGLLIVMLRSVVQQVALCGGFNEGLLEQSLRPFCFSSGSLD